MRPPTDIPSVLARIPRPSRAVVTAGMPYANGPLHIGHLAGAHVPADIHARWLGLLIGRRNVLFVCGTDDHGSTSEVAASRAGVPVREFIDGIHARQKQTMDRYGISLDAWSGTSRPETFPRQVALTEWFIRRLHANGLLEKRTSLQWFDPSLGRFLPDRLVLGTCLNPKCGFADAYSDECPVCGHQHDPADLKDPRSTLSDATPELRGTTHWFLDMAAVAEPLRVWIESRQKVWRQPVYTEVHGTVLPAVRMSKDHEDAVKALKAELPPHKRTYWPGNQLVVQFRDAAGMAAGRALLDAQGIDYVLNDEWGHRSITRDVAWGVPVPADMDPELAGKTLYVWPDSLIAPISFSEVALEQRGDDPADVAKFWKDPDAKVYQFLGQDNVYFYVLMQGAMWIGSQDDPQRLPVAGELQLTEIFGCFHLMLEGGKMSKSLGNFVTADELVLERGYTADQVRYYLALLGLARKQSNFEFATFEERNAFLRGPMNAAIERPVSAAHSQFGGRVPDGKLMDDVVTATEKLVQKYVGAMQKAEYHAMLFDLENYARTINSLFQRFKPHDDRHPEEGRRDALFTCFYVLKNLMIMLSPFTPHTMERLREVLRLPESALSIDELGVPMQAGHEVGPNVEYF
ncbi:MAG: class I tRNA ligase family protein [Alphaproteobacteria bacterium]|nr:class I tRNA ligase family protein [Alphaproteobacteria bacterium]